jgi:hypothetical protein
MAMNTGIDTTDLQRVERTLPTLALPVPDQPVKSPFYRGQFPTTAIVNPDAIKNFQTPGIPAYRIVPPQPLNLAGSSSNATPTTSTVASIVLQPPAPTIAQTLSSIPTGYTFSFFEVRLPVSSNITISAYKIYRNTTSDVSSATAIQTVPHNPATLANPVVVQDAQPNATTQFYWVSAVSTAGIESSLTPAQSATVANKAGFNSNSQLASTFNGLPVNTSWSPTASTVLSNNGLGTTVTISANTNQFAPGQISYNSGSVNSGAFGPQLIFLDDPSFQGGAVPYSVSLFVQGQVTSEGRLVIGRITTSSTATSTGGGTTGGTSGTGAAGGRGLVLLN